MIPMLTLFLPVIVCHKIVETFKHHSYIVPKATVGKSGLVLSVWGEHCHQMDVNKQGANSGRKRSILSIDIVNRIRLSSKMPGTSVSDPG